MFLSPAEHAATAAKIAKINARAAKKGLSGHVTLVSTPTTRTRTVAGGFQVTESGFEAEISGTAPSFGGWTFAARADFVEGTPVLAMAPGFEGSIDRSALAEGKCDHCKIDRARSNTYVLVSESGEQVQVGSSCIKDFLGHVGTFAFTSVEDVQAEAGWGSFGGGERSYDTESILAIAWAAIKTFGFAPSSSPSSTVSVVWTVLFPNPKSDKDMALAEALRPLAEESREQAAATRAFVLSDAFNGMSDYVRNLKAVAASDSVVGKHFGLLVSAPQALARHQERTLIREREAAIPSVHLGTVGEKITVAGTIKAIRYIDGAYGVTVLYTIRDTDGNVVKWFASREALGDKTDVDVKIVGTVKSHSEWNGQAQTTLTRCKAL